MWHFGILPPGGTKKALSRYLRRRKAADIARPVTGHSGEAS